MKKTLTMVALVIALGSSAQKVTDTLLIKIDTVSYQYVRNMIIENVIKYDEKRNPTLSSITLVNGILSHLSNYVFLQPADKPKEQIKTKN